MYEHGFYTAYRRMAGEDLDLVLFLGDYIYEYGPREYQL
jgi:alkaline phosphatase D